MAPAASQLRWLRPVWLWKGAWLVLWLCGALACQPATTPSDGSTPADGSVPTERSTPPERTQSVPSGSFTALTYNVHGLPSGITKDDTNGRLEAIGPLLAPFDIIGLQETFTDDGYAKLKASLKFPTHVRFSKRRDAKKFYGSGLLFLSKYKLLQEQHAFYSYCNGTLDGSSDCLASKGFQMLRVALTEGVELDIYNSHFEAGGGDKDKDARAKNLLELRGAMKRWSKDRALLFLGDTNLHEDRAVDKGVIEAWVKDLGLRDSCEAVNCSDKGRIDRIFYRSSKRLMLKVKRWYIPAHFKDQKTNKPLSDHDPIAATFTWNGQSP